MIRPQPKTAGQCQHQPGRSAFSVNYNLSKCFLKSAIDAYQCRVPGSVKTSIQEKKAMFPDIPSCPSLSPRHCVNDENHG